MIFALLFLVAEIAEVSLSGRPLNRRSLGGANGCAAVVSRQSLRFVWGYACYLRGETV